MIITAIQLKGQTGGMHYIQVLEEDRTFGLARDLQFYWKEIMSFVNVDLIRNKPTGGQELFTSMNSLIFWVTAPLLAASFLTGAVFAVIRKQWEIIVMLITIEKF